MAEGEGRRAEKNLSSLEQLVMYSGAAMNWIGDFFTDPGVTWEKKELRVDDLVLTRTSPEWNAVIIARAEKSPTKLRELLRTDPAVAALFADAHWNEQPILVRSENGYLVFDGMHRVVAAIRDGKETIVAWIATRTATTPPQPACEPHVIYDFLRAYRRGSNRDRDGLITALRFLRKAYGNVDVLLTTRFGPGWLPDEELQAIIAEAMRE